MARRLSIFLLTLAIGSGAIVSTRAAEVPGLVLVSGYHYLPGDNRNPELTLHLDQGSPLDLAVIDTDLHSVTSYDLDQQGNPIFDSGALQPGSIKEVRGASALASGAYVFYCSAHPSMEGTLYIDEIAS